MPDPIRLVIAVPTAGSVSMSFAYSLATMVAWVGANGIPSRAETSFELKMDVVESSNWLTNREQLVKRAIDGGMTHLMFLDDDMVFEPQIIDLLLSRRHPVVITNYLIKTEPPTEFTAVGLDGKRVATTEKSTGLQPVIYGGFGVSIIETKVFKEIDQPWFQPRFDPASSSYTTEDLPFFEKAAAAGYQPLLDHEASRLVSHLGRKSWNWKEYKHG